MIEKNGIQTSYSKSLNTREFHLFNGLNIYLIELPEVWDDLQISDAVNDYVVTKDRDYVFYQRRINTFFVRFKNLGGEFSLCGSGLLALASYLFSEKNFDEDYILFRTGLDRFIKAKLTNGIASLELKKSPVTLIDHNTWQSSSGVFIQKLTKPELSSLSLEQVKSLSKINKWQDSIGGYCGFCIENEKEIHLRYFSPWHGRNEDFATLSIFEHLSNLLGLGAYTVCQNRHKFNCTVSLESISLN